MLNVEKLYDLLEDVVDDEGEIISPADPELFKALFIAAVQEFGDEKYHLVGLALRIQGEFDCFFNDHLEIGVLGDPGWYPKGDDPTRYNDDKDCYGRGGMKFDCRIVEVVLLKKRQIRGMLYPSFQLSINAISFYFDDRNRGRMLPFTCPINNYY